MSTIFIWLGIIFLSILWFPLTGFFYPTNIHHSFPTNFTVAITILALLSLYFSKIKLQLYFTNKLIILYGTALGISIILMPFPYNISSLCLAVGIVLYYFTNIFSIKKQNFIRRVISVFITSGIVLLLQSIIIPFFMLFSSRFHQTEIFTNIILFLSRISGLNILLANGMYFIKNNDVFYSLIPSWEAYNLLLFLLILLGSWAVFLLFKFPKRNYFKIAITLIFLMILRYIFIILIFLETKSVSIFWNFEILVLSGIFVSVFLTIFIPFKDNMINNTLQIANSIFNKKYALFSSLIIVSSISWIIFFGFVDPGLKKEGRVLIDEKHSDWEWTTKKFDINWYGKKSTYNYYCLSEYLKNYYSVDINREKITGELLEKYDILFIKTPTEPFLNSEIDAILKFVERGGGLFLIGDHTNVFGITSNLNPIASRFGIKFRYDGQYDLEGEHSIFIKPLILPHPVVHNLPKFSFATGCMLDAPLLAENVMIGYGIKSIYLDYSRKNFFPKDARNNENMEFGLFLQAAGITYGKGRVLLFTDSTVWSNFYMFISGKPELLLGIMEWLNRENSIFVYLRIIFLIIGILSTALLFIYCFKTKRFSSNFTTGIFWLLIIVPITIIIIEALNKHFYPPPQPNKKFSIVNFEYEYSDYELPLYHTTQNWQRSYHTFYVAVQRLGLTPFIKFNLENALKEGKALVIINPTITFNTNTVNKIKNYLEKGGKLFLLDEPRLNNHKYANSLLEKFGMKLMPGMGFNLPVRFCYEKDDTNFIYGAAAGRVEGGKPLLYGRLQSYRNKNKQRRNGRIISKNDFLYLNEYNVHGSKINKQKNDNIDIYKTIGKFTLPGNTEKVWPVMAEKEFGNGIIVAMTGSFVFTDSQMGSSGAVPNKNQRKIYALQYKIFNDILGLKQKK